MQMIVLIYGFHDQGIMLIQVQTIITYKGTNKLTKRYNP